MLASAKQNLKRGWGGRGNNEAVKCLLRLKTKGGEIKRQ